MSLIKRFKKFLHQGGPQTSSNILLENNVSEIMKIFFFLGKKNLCRLILINNISLIQKYICHIFFPPSKIEQIKRPVIRVSRRYNSA